MNQFDIYVPYSLGTQCEVCKKYYHTKESIDFNAAAAKNNVAQRISDPPPHYLSLPLFSENGNCIYCERTLSFEEEKGVQKFEKEIQKLFSKSVMHKK